MSFCEEKWNLVVLARIQEIAIKHYKLRANNWFEESRRFTECERKVLLWRGGKKECVTDSDMLNICYHHHSKLGPIFQRRFTKCCNLFKTHKRNVKEGHKISLQLATKLVDHGYECIRVWQLCRTCYDMAQKIEKNVGNEMSQSEHKSPQISNKLDSATTDYSTSDIDSDEAKISWYTW